MIFYQEIAHCSLHFGMCDSKFQDVGDTLKIHPTPIAQHHAERDQLHEVIYNRLV